MQTIARSLPHALPKAGLDLSQLSQYVLSDRCASHPFFAYLRENELSTGQIKTLLRNYDAHAALLRRLLLKAATLMPESAVGFILENVRNEYGNGSFSNCHQAQLLDLAMQCGLSTSGFQQAFQQARITDGVRSFMKKAPQYYFPRPKQGHLRAAIAAGAITTTEVLALEEFKALQCVFVSRGLQNHVWFDHVNVEAEHTAESIELALHFADHSWDAVNIGIDGMLDATYDLYDGLFEAASS